MDRALMLVVVLTVFAPGGARAATILSDNFDSENGGVGALNYTAFANFSVSNGTVDLIPLATGQFNFMPGNGLYVDLDGSSNDAGVLTSDAFSLGAGSYLLSFDLAGSRRSGSPFDTVTVRIFGGANPNYASLTLTLPFTMGFTPLSLGFDLLSSDTVQFSFSNSGGDNQGALLDRVVFQSVNDTVPEPAALLLFGLVALALAPRFRRRARSQ